jgi:CBS domain-containing protein
VTKIDEVEGLTAADVMHSHVTTLPASASVAELREYFGASGSRRLALLVEDGRYAGAVPVESLSPDADPATPAASLVTDEPTIGPDAPAVEARRLALELPTRRVPVLDESGALLGIVAVDEHHTRFCGT